MLPPLLTRLCVPFLIQHRLRVVALLHRPALCVPPLQSIADREAARLRRVERGEDMMEAFDMDEYAQRMYGALPVVRAWYGVWT